MVYSFSGFWEFLLSSDFSRRDAAGFLYAFLIPFYAAFAMFILGSNAGVGLLGLYAVGAKWLIGRSAFGKRIAARMSKRTGGRSGGWSSGSGWSSGGWGVLLREGVFLEVEAVLEEAEAAEAGKQTDERIC
jgi:hypothetical protein